MAARKTSPILVRHIWDAINSCVAQRQQANFERVSKYLMRTHELTLDSIEEALTSAMDDGLIRFTQRLGNKGSKRGEEQELYKLPNNEVTRTGSDWYCGECHTPGEMLNCTDCPSSFHAKCVPESQRQDPFVCPVCQHQSAEEPDSNVIDLNTILKYAMRRLNARFLPVSSVQPSLISPSVDKDIELRAQYMLYRPLEIADVQDKLDKEAYMKLSDFERDIRLMVHNIIVMNGAESEVAIVARQVLMDCDYDITEIRRCRDCYRMSNEKSTKYWFCRPCRPPHELVFAKQKGYPYWPAKVMSLEGGVYDVRFFGEPYERALVPQNNIRPISTPIQAMQIKRSACWSRAYDQLHRHQALLKRFETDPDAQLPDDEPSTPDSGAAAAVEQPRPRKGRRRNSALPTVPVSPAVRQTPAATAAPPTAVSAAAAGDESEDDGCVEVNNTVLTALRKSDPDKQDCSSPDNKVSSSSPDQQPRTVATQTPAKFLTAVAASHLNSQKSVVPNGGSSSGASKAAGGGGAAASGSVTSQQLERELERLRASHRQEVAALELVHRQQLSQSKRKQWCFNCEQEAIYHCCWNTAYCSTECQQTHWHKEHKRVCRRKRTT